MSRRFLNPVSVFLLVLGQSLRKFEYNLYQRFWKAYSSTLESAGIGSTYSSAFKSAGISYIHIFVKVIPTQVKTPEQGLKNAGTYPGAFEKR